MPTEEAPDDDDLIRQTYNFAPGYHGLIYRANTPGHHNEDDAGDDDSGEPSLKKAKTSHHSSQTVVDDGRATEETKYKLQAAKWGLIPFWTKRPPEYGSQLKTINCRDDSLIENRGMWNTMKQRRRCIVIAEGFFEWLKKNNGKEKIPHFTKRKDGHLMCFAGLWDMVQYEGSNEKIYTYSIITTDSNKQLRFLHDRMPVILDPQSKELKAWLDPNNIGWSKELQSMLKPYEGELECYPVDKAVGKVGNNSPSFIVPIDSKENKQNIANFFRAQRAMANDAVAKNAVVRGNRPNEIKQEREVKQEEDEHRETTIKLESTEDNAPLPIPVAESEKELSRHMNKDSAEISGERNTEAANENKKRTIKHESTEISDRDSIKTKPSPSPPKSRPNRKPPSAKKTRSATSNQTVAKTPTKGGNAKITSFFGK